MYYSGYKISKYILFLGIYFLVVILGVVDFFGLGSLLKYLAFLPIAFGLLGRKGNLQGWRTVVVYYLFAILSYLWSVNSNMSGDTAFAYFTFLLLLYTVSTQYYNVGEYHFLRECLRWSSLISAAASWMFATFSEGRLIIREGVMNEDPNYLCGYFYFGIAYCVETFFTKSTKKGKMICIAEILFYLFTIFCTGSRGGLFGGIAVASIVFIKTSGIKSIGALISRFFYIGILAFLIPVVASLVNPDVMDRFSKEAISESDGSGRWEIWDDAFRAFDKSNFMRQLIGNGMGASREVAQMFHFARVNVMHNVLLENLIGVGIIGTILYILSVIAFYKKSKCSTFAMAVFTGMIILSLSTSILYLKPSWNSMLFIMISSLASFQIDRSK